MKKAITFQIFVVLIILSGWNFLHIGYHFQKQFYYNELSEKPMILICDELSTLDSIKSLLEQEKYIRKIEIETENDVTKNLIEIYKLQKASDFIRNYHLPNVMKIYFYAQNFDYKRKVDFEIIISDSSIQKNYDDLFWNKTQQRVFKLNKAYKIANWVFILFTIFFIALIRVYFEQKSHEFWKIFRASGGHIHRRRDKYILHSTFLILLPLLMNIGLYYGLKIYKNRQIFVDYRLFIIEFFTLIMAMLFARLIMGKKF
jgi:hypothetical protein